ncbi:MarR family transcriptional regulator [Streptomyces niveiscabiei]|uniref:MarR family winged helix-turn-helix transcriptional regulator n=1 Tax=Streptomyces niveiscabiei TaxID=164115 RepID=UPI0029BB68BD|nr:MarR family transcriptional regulator [Streptomyces niveiscabiei]MDX3384677.1 MarR family transcriptional regulator [Streptomyces niveiscabiei]
MTQWLTNEELLAWHGLMQLSSRLQTDLGRQLQDDHGISVADYEVLGRLNDADAGVRARDLGASLNWEQSRVSHQLARMRRRGLVERSDCETDRRGVTFRLTEAGRTTLEAAAPGHVDTVRALVFNALSPEQVTQLAELTGHLMRHVDTCPLADSHRAAVRASQT